MINSAKKVMVFLACLIITFTSLITDVNASTMHTASLEVSLKKVSPETIVWLDEDWGNTYFIKLNNLNSNLFPDGVNGTSLKQNETEVSINFLNGSVIVDVAASVDDYITVLFSTSRYFKTNGENYINFYSTGDIHQTFPSTMLNSSMYSTVYDSEDVMPVSGPSDWYFSGNSPFDHGWLSSSIRMDDQEIGLFTIKGTLNYHPAQNTAPVPLPGAIWLLGSGLVGVISTKLQRD